MVIDTITQYILALSPAVTALVAIIVTVAVGVGKVRNAINGNTESVERTSRSTNKIIESLGEQNKILRDENRELKKALVELNKKIEIIDTIKATKRE